MSSPLKVTATKDVRHQTYITSSLLKISIGNMLRLLVPLSHMSKNPKCQGLPLRGHAPAVKLGPVRYSGNSGPALPNFWSRAKRSQEH